MKILYILLLFTYIAVSTSFSNQPKIYLKKHFNNLNEKRHPNFKEGVPWINARKYIDNKMYYYGIKNIVRQSFNTSIHDEETEGVNIIGIVEGENATGPIIVVGADYSTSQVGNHLKNNTGGVAVLLETIHLFLHYTLWDYYHHNFTVIFVAFDLNTREYFGSGMGMPGSYYFLHQWLLPYISETNPHREYHGAIILDSVTTYNPRNETQILRQGFDEAMPEADSKIRARGMKGDFLGFLYTSQQANNSIVSTFVQNYNRERILRLFRLQEMKLQLSVHTITSDDVINLINHQSHFHFLTQNLHGEPMPAFLLFDTDGDRTDPTPDACNPIKCDIEKFLTQDRLRFMEKTTQTLVQTLLNLQTTYIEPDSSACSKTVPSIVLLSVITAITSFVFKY